MGVEQEIEKALASGNVDDATLDGLLSSASAELTALKGGGQPNQQQRMAQGLQAKRTKQAALEAEPDPMSLGEMAKELPSNMGALASQAMNGATFGGFDALRRHLPSGWGGDTARTQMADEAQRLDSPVGQVSGGVMRQVGGMLPMAPMAQGLTGLIENAVPAMGKFAGGRVATNALTGAGVGATAGATEAGFEGKGFKDVAKAGGESALVGGVLGGGLSLPGEVAKSARGALRDTRSELGQTVTEHAKAKASGRIPGEIENLKDRYLGDDKGTGKPYAEVKRTKFGQPGVDEVADTVAQEMADYNPQVAADARAKFGAVQKKVLKARGKKFESLSGLHSALDAMDAENTVNGEPVDKRLATAISDYRDMFTKDTGIYSPAAKTTIKVQGGTLEDVTKAKKATKRMANPEGLSTEENRPYRIIGKALSAEAKAIGGTKLRAAMAEYAETMDRLAEANDLAFSKDKPVLKGPNATAERGAAARLGRNSENNLRNPNEATSMRQREELASLDPKYRDMLERIDAKAVYEGTRMPDLSIENLKKLVQEPLKHSGRLLGQSSNAIAARVLDPALQSMNTARPNGMLPGWIPGIEFAAETARRKKKRR